jgi:hypothetical protein
MSYFSILLGSLMVIVGVFHSFLEKFGLGQLPGDILFSKNNFTIYFPITTSLLCSLILTLIFWLVKK